MDFEEQVKNWVVLDNQLRLHNERIKELREKRNRITDKITSYAETNNLTNSRIAITGGQLRFQNNRIATPLTFKFVEKCLSEVISSSEQTTQIMNYIKANREIKYVPDIKRYNEN